VLIHLGAPRVNKKKTNKVNSAFECDPPPVSDSSHQLPPSIHRARLSNYILRALVIALRATKCDTPRLAPPKAGCKKKHLKMLAGAAQKAAGVIYLFRFGLGALHTDTFYARDLVHSHCFPFLLTSVCADCWKYCIYSVCWFSGHALASAAGTKNAFCDACNLQ
jgi:hypothetical protein